MMKNADIAKRAAAARALEFVEPGMKLGLGTGSTAAHFIELLGAQARAEEMDLLCVPTSIKTGKQAAKAGLPLVTLGEAGWLDLTIDGADEIDGDLQLIKGGGGALLKEKIIAAASDGLLVIADDAKLAPYLGAFKLPVEIVQFGWEVTMAIIEEELSGFDIGGSAGTLRMNGDKPFLTDEGHLIVDIEARRIGDPAAVAEFLPTIPGVVESGLFIDLASSVIIGDAQGRTEIIHAEPETPTESL